MTDTHSSTINPGDDFQQRPEADAISKSGSDQQPEGGAPVIQFTSYGTDRTINMPPLQGNDPTQQRNSVFRIIEVENDDAPGDYHGIVMYSPGTVIEEIDGKKIPATVVTGFSAYERHDPRHDNDVELEFDPETGMVTITDISDPNNPVVITRNAHVVARDDSARTFTVEIGETDDADRDALDAYMRRQDKSILQATRAAVDGTMKYNSALAQAFCESSAYIMDVMQQHIAPAINEAAEMARYVLQEKIYSLQGLKTAQEIDPAIEATKELARSLPVIDADYLRTVGESFREWGRQNLILLTMLQHWKGINEIIVPYQDTLNDDDDAQAEGDRVINALRILAAAYSETHGGIDGIISDDGTSFDLPAEAETEIRALIEEYSAFHNSSGAESYVFTAQLFAKAHFPASAPGAIVVSDRLTAISLQNFQFALTTRPNPTAFIAPLGTGMFTKFRWDDATGQVINVKTRQPVQETQTPVETASMMKTAAESVTTPDFVLLTALYSVLLRNVSTATISLFP